MVPDIQFTVVDLQTPEGLERVLRQVQVALNSMGQTMTAMAPAAQPPPTPAKQPVLIPVTGTNIVQTPDHVTISSTGVTSIVAGSGISASPTTGDVTVANTGVLSIIAGTNITVSGATGNVTVNSTASGAMTQLYDNLLNADTTNVTISSISQAFTHLMFVFNGRTTTNFDVHVTLQFNGDTGQNYEWQITLSNNTSASGNRSPIGGSTFAVAGAAQGTNSNRPNSAGPSVAWLPDYTSTTFEKNLTCKHGYYSDSGVQGVDRGSTSFWHSTVAITSLLVGVSSGNMKAGSRISLYGF